MVNTIPRYLQLSQMSIPNLNDIQKIKTMIILTGVGCIQSAPPNT